MDNKGGNTMTKSTRMTLLKWIAVLAVVFAFVFTFHARITYAADVYSVKVSKGYLALRSDKVWDDSNIMNKLYTGDIVEVQDKSDQYYWYVYVPKFNKSGYVDKRYVAAWSSSYTRTVNVDENYLALRSAKAYDYYNEIGKLYNGDTVTVINVADSTYWWVYSSSLGKSGYVNKNYLTQSGGSSGGSSSSSRETVTVSVATGYLALRTAPAYDASNEIGELYSGDTVEVISKGGTYWWVYSPKLGKEGYINSNYIVGNGGSSSDVYKTVSVATGYLALRTAPAYDDANEIGELYSGETVKVLDTSNGQYWWVYSTKLGKEGYVNSDYLY